jgi:hypothetical protein
MLPRFWVHQMRTSLGRSGAKKPACLFSKSRIQERQTFALSALGHFRNLTTHAPGIHRVEAIIVVIGQLALQHALIELPLRTVIDHAIRGVCWFRHLTLEACVLVDLVREINECVLDIHL